MAFINSIKLRKDLTKITDPDPEVRLKKILAWAKYATERQEFIDKARGLANYSDLVARYDALQPARLW